MDNAYTHMSYKIEATIVATDAILIHGVPYSLHLNIIEYYFAQYKSYLKINDKQMLYEWYAVHTEALNVVDRDMGINYFRKSKIPGFYACLISTEYYNSVY